MATDVSSLTYHVADANLSDAGVQRIEWAERFMPVLRDIRTRFAKEKPLQGAKVAACLHVTTETANLMRTLKEGGAEVTLCASNPLSTQDDVAAALSVHYGIPTFAIRGEDNDSYYSHIRAVLANGPHYTMDDGADLVTVVHTERKELLKTILGGTEETSTGVIRLRSMEANKVLGFPVIAVNDAKTKHFFDNRYGTGQSTVDGIVRATNVLIAGSTWVIAGYGWCGRGLAMRARGMGANVIVTEIEPLAALEAVMDGFRVMPMEEAAPLGDVFVTLTGNLHVVRKEHFERMKDGAIVCNSGHFNVELDLDTLAKITESRRPVRPFVEEFKFKNGKRVFILGEGRLINLAAAEGHPAMVMDMSFANQALSLEYMKKEGPKLEKKVYVVPADIDREIARLKLVSMGSHIDALTAEQVAYLASWEAGT